MGRIKIGSSRSRRSNRLGGKWSEAEKFFQRSTIMISNRIDFKAQRHERI